MKKQIQGIDIFYIKKGQGRPFLFIHGWGGSHKSLLPLAYFFTKKYTVYILDLPGFGLSDNPKPSWGVKDYAELIRNFCSILHIRHPLYFGHSFGGSLGIYLSSKYPDFIAKLILCASAFKRNQKSIRFLSSLKQFYLSLPGVKMTYHMVRNFFYRLLFRNSDLIRYPQLESNFRKIISEDLTALLTRIKTKTLILWGENDTQTPVAWAYELKTAFQDSKLKIFSKGKHNLPLVKPALVAQEVYQFLTS